MDLRDEIQSMSETLTPAERKLAAVLLSDYPFAGLDTIQSLARRTDVSAPSIARFVQKLGCNGYQEFQRRLIGELKDGRRSPVDLRQPSGPVEDGFLRHFLARTAGTLRAATDVVTEAQFERISALLGDEKRSIYIIGGRISDPIAQHFLRHLRQVRRNVFHLPPDPEAWPEYLLRMRPRDLLVMVDFRRYQRMLDELAKTASQERGVGIILVTDRWISPIATSATEVLALPVENDTAWDTYVGALAVLDAVTARVSELDWDATRKRIEAWDEVRLRMGIKQDDR
ncbi:MurR/RpiR family transcriptional regulator [Labrys monachus]|uniref:DNA-binding MurR/RpiR family transcriptional regulator n=1 Tax=Labrys monachus TaxID=217067 RepID=A0ABU0FIM4_9HYPH|nr:MurR/RpiR family transcriptional regulator [Labrys monachus]MDQ0394464.1 DNA-binding MurR/RpiR family transcriptional regulator [Labrys monachus]